MHDSTRDLHRCLIVSVCTDVTMCRPYLGLSCPLEQRLVDGVIVAENFQRLHDDVVVVVM